MECLFLLQRLLSDAEVSFEIAEATQVHIEITADEYAILEEYATQRQKRGNPSPHTDLGLFCFPNKATLCYRVDYRRTFWLTKVDPALQ